MTPGQRNGVRRIRRERSEGGEPVSAADREQERLNEIAADGPRSVASAPKKKRKTAKRKAR